MTLRILGTALVAGWMLTALAGCDAGSSGFEPIDVPGGGAADGGCIVPRTQFADGGVGKDGIPALTDPLLVGAGDAAYLNDADRVIGLLVDGAPVAVPHNILWWHEIVNFTFGDLKLAVTYCPLTGSSMAFNRNIIGGGEFGVSGLLFQNNLTMYDRTTSESLWTQMSRQASCGPRVGTPLQMYPVIEMTWGGWRALHPDTEVISGDTGIYSTGRYRIYPYGNYEDPNNGATLFPMDVNTDRPPKERVLGIAGLGGGIAFPFFELDELGPIGAVVAEAPGGDVVVFWDRERRAAMAYRPRAEGQALTFEVRDGRLLDGQTGSAWRVDGQAVEGSLAGVRLEPVADAYVAFWFAWRAFDPQTRVWEAP